MSYCLHSFHSVSAAAHFSEDYSLSSDHLLHTPTYAAGYPLTHIVSVSDTSDCTDHYHPFRLPMDWLRLTTSGVAAQTLITSESMRKAVSGK